MTRESRLIKNTAIIAVGNICTKCISFFLLPLYTAILSTEEYGTVDLIATYVSLLVIIISMQMEQGVFRFLVEARGDVEKQNRYISTTFLSVGIVSLAFFLVFAPILTFTGYKYTWYLVFWVIIGSFNTILLQIPRGLGNTLAYTIGSFISGSSNVLLNVLFVAVLRMGIIGMLWASIISVLLCALFLSFILRLWQRIKLSQIDKPCFRELCSYSFPLIPYTLCWWIISASDREIINLFLGVSKNGIYSVAYKFPTLLSLFTGFFQTAWTESAAENIDVSDRTLFYNKTINSTIRCYSSCNILLLCGIPLIFGFLIHPNYEEAYYYIPILLIGTLFHSATALHGSIYFAFKKTKEVAWTSALAALINIVVNLAFIKRIGLFAAAISTAVSYAVVFIIRQYDIQKTVKLTISKKYLLCEAFWYAIVLAAYYSRSTIFIIFSLVVSLPYCLYQNKELIAAIRNRIKKQTRRKEMP